MNVASQDVVKMEYGYLLADQSITVGGYLYLTTNGVHCLFSLLSCHNIYIDILFFYNLKLVSLHTAKQYCHFRCHFSSFIIVLAYSCKYASLDLMILHPYGSELGKTKPFGEQISVIA